jgi:hypothetical protein
MRMLAPAKSGTMANQYRKPYFDEKSATAIPPIERITRAQRVISSTLNRRGG